MPSQLNFCILNVHVKTLSDVFDEIDVQAAHLVEAGLVKGEEEEDTGSWMNYFHLTPDCITIRHKKINFTRVQES